MRIALGRRVAAGLAVGGGVLAPLAGFGLMAGDGDRSAPAVAGPTAAGPLDGLAVNVKRATYQPGQSSGWHAHAGIHTVIVTSGVLRVYDSGCLGRSYGVDEPYVGGMQDHLARQRDRRPGGDDGGVRGAGARRR